MEGEGVMSAGLWFRIHSVLDVELVIYESLYSSTSSLMTACYHLKGSQSWSDGVKAVKGEGTR